jgi:phosphomannomutase
LDPDGQGLQVAGSELRRIEAIRADLMRFFTPALGFSLIARLNYTDGVRVVFDNGDVAHIRPSGNADELRIYAVAGTQARAEQIASAGVATPGGILRAMEKAVAG